MKSHFEELLEELGKFLHLDLHTDHLHACSIQIRPRLTVQLQLDTSEENLWLFIPLVETPPGKFRENILKEALKFNARPNPKAGILGYIARTNQLALFQKFPLKVLTAERLAGGLAAFVELAENWKEAIESGQSAPMQVENKPQSNPFGI